MRRSCLHRLFPVVFALLACISLAWAQTPLPAPKLAGPLVIQPVTVSWVAVTGADHYRLELSLQSDLSALVLSVDPINSTNYNLPALLTGTPYFWRVRAVSAGGVDGVWSPTWAFTTQPVDLPPTAPTLLAPNNQAPDISITPVLSWTAVPGATSYLLQVDTEDTFIQPLTYTDQVNDTVIDMPDLEPATMYYWRVCAVNLAGQGPWSATWSFTTVDPTLALTTPVLSSPANGAPSVQRPVALSWQSVPSASRYEVQISESNTFGILAFIKNDIGSTSYTVQGLQASRQYYWRVRAINDYDTSDWSTVWNFITAPSLNPPQPPVLSSPRNGAASVLRPAHLVWNASVNAERYELQMSPFGYFPFNAIVYNNNNIPTPTIDVPNLVSNKTYFWRVRAINGAGISPWSTIWVFTTGSDLVNPPADAPTLIYPAHSASDVNLAPTLTWNAVNRATTYLVRFSRSDEFSYAPTRNTTYTYLRVSALTPNTEYYWQVRAFNNSGYGPWSTVYAFRTGRVPEQPNLATPTDGAIGVQQPVQLTWVPGTSTRPQTFTVDVSTTADFANLLVHRESITGNTFTLPTLPENAQYFWRVRATNEIGNSAWTLTWSFWTSPPPVKPDTLQVHHNQVTGAMELSWAPVAGWTTYELQSNVDGVGYTTLSAAITGSAYTYMPPGGTHTINYRVRGVNGAETTEWSDPASVTYSLDGIWLTGYYENGPDPRFLVLNWNSVPAATRYDIEFQGALPFITWTALGTVNAPTTEFRSLPNFTGVTQFRIRSFSPATGYSAWSNPITITIPAG